MAPSAMRIAILISVLCARPVAGLWGGRRRRAPVVVCDDVPEEVTVDATQCTSVTKQRTAYRPVAKFRTQTRNVTKYDTMTRTATVQKTVEFFLPLEDFYETALKQIMGEIQAGLQQGTTRQARDESFAWESDECEGPCKEAVVTWGRTQAGKSTTVCQLRLHVEESCPEVGDGSGESVTDTPRLVDSAVGWLVDTPGIDDTKLRFTKEEAGQRTALAVAAANVSRVKFLVFDSMANDGMQLRDTLASLQVAFGSQAQRGAVVVASKANLRPGAMGEKRLAALRAVMAEQGLRELVALWGPSLEEAGLEALKLALSRVPGVPIAELDDLRQRQRQRAQDLHDQQPPRTKTVEVEVEEQYTMPRQEEEEYEVPYVDQEAFMEDYEAMQCSTVPQRSTVMARKCRTV